MKVEFYCLGNNQTGYGHLYRCLTIASYLRKKKWKVNFNILGNLKSKQTIIKYKFKGDTYLSFVSLLKKKPKISDNKSSYIAIVDITHDYVLTNEAQLLKFIKFLDKNYSKIVIIDSFGNQSLSKIYKHYRLSFNLLIIPYVTNLKSRKKIFSEIIGKKYFIFSDHFRNIKKRQIQKKANKILITCGGSDPKNVSISILKSLNKINIPLNVRVVIGPLFKNYLIKSIKKLSQSMKHKVVLFNSPLHLRNHMLWSDLAISTSGLTKYELSLTGTPSILISIDEYHDKMNKSFNKIGSSVDFGNFDKKKISSEKIENILLNYQQRKKMSICGQKAFDALGIKRIINRIEAL